MKRVSNLDVHVMLNDRCLMPSVQQKFELLQGYKNVVIKQTPSLHIAHRPETKLFALGPHHICHFFTSLPYFAWIHKRHIRIRPYFPGQMITYLLATAAQRIPSSIPSPGEEDHLFYLVSCLISCLAGHKQYGWITYTEWSSETFIKLLGENSVSYCECESSQGKPPDEVNCKCWQGRNFLCQDYICHSDARVSVLEFFKTCKVVGPLIIESKIKLCNLKLRRNIEKGKN